MNIPQISVIVPVYNVEKYLSRCIESILSQTFTDFELLLIDDGSTDRSGEICDEYAKKDTRIRVFHTKNRGVSAARNLGLDNAKGEWISFVDSDDWVENDYLKSLFNDNFLTENKCVICESVYVDFEKYNRKRFILPDVILVIPFNKDIIVNKILNGYNSFIYAKLFNKKIIIENKTYFCENITICEDVLFFHEYLQYVKRICISSSVFYHYSRREIITLSKKEHSSEEMLIGAEKILRINTILIKKFAISDMLDQKRIYNIYGLPQLYAAFTRVNKNNYAIIFNHVREYKYLFKKYFVPQTFLQKIFLRIFFNNLIPNQCVFVLLSIYKNLIKH